MSKEIYISSTPHETRLAIVENDALAEIYYERENEYTLAGSIYNGKVTRVLPGMQSSFVDIGLERDAFLYITDFMEEAGDSADFDTNGDGSQRAPRHDGRGDRSGNREPQTLEGAPADDSNRSGRGDRDRGGRGRRGRGDRSGNRDRQPGMEYAQPVEGQDAYVTEFNRTDEFVPTAEGTFTERTDASEIGEGAPGADGSRRWRGRRGRRRGRGGPRVESQPQTGVDAPLESASNEVEYESTFEIDGAGERPVSNESAPVVADAPQENFNRGDRGDRGRRDDRGRGDRGGRDRDGRGRGDRDRGGRGDQRRVPRGFAPKTALYGVDNTPAYDEAPASDGHAPEPIVLPGESLSKYRTGGQEPASSQSSVAQTAGASKAIEPHVIIPQVASYVIPDGWDGGSTLPGESLSRHRRSEPRQEPRPEFADQVVPAPVVPVAQEAEVAVTALLDQAPAAEPVVVEEPKPTEPIVPVEYEPIEASASYRLDPVAPSEFRQSAPIIEPELVEEVEERAEQAETLPASTLNAVFDHVEEREIDYHAEQSSEPELIEHAVTTLHATGEMISETPADPVEVEAKAFHQDFAPVSGETEEEILEEEEDFRATLHASAIEEIDDLDEEETLEGAADLGTMLREMSIDQITSSGVEEEEEDDLEEEDTIDDRTFDEIETEEEDLDESEDAEPEDTLIQEEFADGAEPVVADGFEQTAPTRERREGDRGRGRRDGRRDGRRGGRDRDRSRHTGGAGDHDRSGGRDRRGGRSSMQSTNLPAISDLLKPGQEVLVQIAKEPIAKKGARITSHIALPGRFLVFMPTVNHTGVSRKIESDGERRRLKEILLSEKGEATGGFIVRTAASGASEEELRSDLRFLLNLWADIKQRSESSKSPALIYHDLNLVERILRDQVTDNFSAIWVDSESEYERVLRFLQRFQPSLIRRVKLYTKETPLFEQFGITEEINKALRSKVWLKSGGSIVINQTEALVAIDINTGKYVGKTARLEDTIVKTNLDAIPEIVRQIRLRDLGGIIIIDFIDMDERKNRHKVMAALEEELKTDRAPSKVLQFNDFGLVAITRKRVKQSLERTLSTTCGVCTGTGMVKSPVTVCNDIYIEMRKMNKHLDRGDVMLRVNPEVVKQLKAPGTRWLQEMEEMVGKTILVKSDPALHPEQFDIH
ncbi:ribonuclease G [Edaphobacter aggregans]|uniref:Ribonuclease G n=1 Tax=Edaphobacter aggregans TaxID=570835 RepID=A0A3R9QA07_9BACT|nr:Rne/Rng family ribonuclease [Edaphobacter aggregans]RSL16204.1 ribonuclease G [Edaphobacter aggregans]